MMQTSWAAQLNPLLANPLNDINIIPSVQLVIGNNIINHKLGQMQQGWFLTDINAASVIYRSAPLNATSLSLNSSAVCTVSIGVF